MTREAAVTDKKIFQMMSLEQIARAALASGTDEAVADRGNLEGLPKRFPIAVSTETRVFLEYQARALHTSIAGLAGVILEGVAAETIKRREGTNVDTRSHADSDHLNEVSAKVSIARNVELSPIQRALLATVVEALANGSMSDGECLSELPRWHSLVRK